VKAYAIAQSLYQKLKALLAIKWLRLALEAVILLLCAVYLVRSLGQSSAALKDLQLDLKLLLAALGAALLSLYLGALAWTLILRSLGEPVNLLTSLRNHLVSNFAKYLPGYGWQILGKAYLTRQQAVPGTQIGYGLAIELSLLVVVGLALGLVFLPVELAQQWLAGGFSTALLQTLRIGSLLIIGLLLLGLPYFGRYLKINAQPLAIQAGTYWIALLVVACGWLALGVSFWLLGAAIQPAALSQFPIFVFALAASVLLGLAVFLVPSGIGVRESLMVALLGPVLTTPVAVLIAGASRFLYILADCIGVIPIEAAYRLRRRPEPPQA
jgi:hypothetical protein